MKHEKTFAAIAKLSEIELELHRLKSALEMANRELEANDEPVGWAEHGVINWLADKQFNHTSFLYATPPKREWVGLTDEDVLEALTFIDKETKRVPFMLMRFAVAIQAKLKEKNT